MKNFIALFILVFATSALAQIKFINPDTLNLKSLKSTKENHLLILRTYRKQIDSEVRRLVSGIEYETNGKAPKLRLSSYKNLLVQLLIKRIFLSELEKQLIPIDIDKYIRQPQPRKPLFNTDSISLNLENELGIHLDSIVKKESVGHYFLNDLKKNLIKNTLTTFAKKTYQSIGSGLLTKIIANGVTSAALKSTVMSMGSKIFVSAGTATVLSILTMPLQSYRLPPETIWTDILHKNPELIINPDWMKYAKTSDDPWWSHAYAILRRTKQMERAFNTLMSSEEAEFQAQVRNIAKITEFKKTEEYRYNPYAPKVDNTYVKKPLILDEPAPFWAMKK